MLRRKRRRPLVLRNDTMALYAVRVVHGAFPALAWRVEMGGKRIVFSGDTNGDGRPDPAGDERDLFVAHNAVPEDATGVERRLHMPPSVIGTTAAHAHVKQLVLSHRMLRTLGEGRCDAGRRIRGVTRGRLHLLMIWIVLRWSERVAGCWFAGRSWWVQPGNGAGHLHWWVQERFDHERCRWY